VSIFSIDLKTSVFQHSVDSAYFCPNLNREPAVQECDATDAL